MRLGSSKNWPKTGHCNCMNVNEDGTLDKDCNCLYMPYGDGASFSGYRAEPWPVQQKELPPWPSGRSCSASETVGKVLSFLGVVLPDARLEAVTEKFTFERMHAMERSGGFSDYGVILRPRNSQDPESYKTRRGEVGGYRRYLSPEDIDWCDKEIAKSGLKFNRLRAG